MYQLQFIKDDTFCFTFVNYIHICKIRQIHTTGLGGFIPVTFVTWFIWQMSLVSNISIFAIDRGQKLFYTGDVGFFTYVICFHIFPDKNSFLEFPSWFKSTRSVWFTSSITENYQGQFFEILFRWYWRGIVIRLLKADNEAGVAVVEVSVDPNSRREARPRADRSNTWGCWPV